ncbi:MAG: THxN family PEP-CTERM protein [Azoarcus sp.]|jgi:hypothetical protein|nr:THxN family PEP-CTERM protein [Azoarcus sp.]
MNLIRKLAAASVLTFAASASQAAVVDNFNYTLDLQWLGASFSSGSVNSTTTFTPTELSWGYIYGDYKNGYYNQYPDYARSALVISDSTVKGAISTDGSTVNANMFTHYNSVINGTYKTLEKAQLAVTVNLGVNGVGTVQNLTTIFDVYFIETPNTGGTCAWGPCDNDIFAILSVDPKLNDLTRSFTYNGQEYSFSYFETTANLNPLSSTACAAAGVNGACYGFTTLEGNNTTVKFALSVTAVPEPETYAMMLAGLGLIGAVVRRRRTPRS